MWSLETARMEEKFFRRGGRGCTGLVLMLEVERALEWISWVFFFGATLWSMGMEVW